MTRTLRSLIVALAVSLVVVGCGDDTSGESKDPTSPTTAPGAAVTPVGPGISVSEALESDLDEPLLVNGFIVAVEGGEVRLAEVLAESFPPQPGGAILVVEGLDVGSLEGTTTAQGVTWTDELVQILGTVEEGVLTVSTTASA